MTKIQITIFRDGGDVEETLTVPARYEICPTCEGCGTDRGASVECDGGGFTSSEWAEQDDDFKAGYLAGAYDQPCASCRGTPGRVLVPDLDALSAEDRAAYEQDQRDDAEERWIRRMEMRSGA